MNTDQVAVVAVGLAVGYWVVSGLMSRATAQRTERPQDASASPRAHDEEPRRDPYQQLGLSPTASIEQIRTAYRTLVVQYHPDKVASLGPELRALAEARTKDLTVAYNELVRRHS